MVKRTERREEILEAARKLFSERGYHGVSLGDIAEQAGLSVGLIYYVFQKKEDILLGVIQDASLLYRQVFTRVKLIDNPILQIDTVLHELVHTLDEGARVIRILYKDLSAIDKDTRQQILALERETAVHIAQIIEDGKHKRVFNPSLSSQLVAFNLIGIGHLWALKKSWLFPQMTADEFIREQQSLVHAMLLVPQA